MKKNLLFFYSRKLIILAILIYSNLIAMEDCKINKVKAFSELFEMSKKEQWKYFEKLTDLELNQLFKQITFDDYELLDDNLSDTQLMLLSQRLYQDIFENLYLKVNEAIKKKKEIIKQGIAEKTLNITTALPAKAINVESNINSNQANNDKNIKAQIITKISQTKNSKNKKNFLSKKIMIAIGLSIAVGSTFLIYKCFFQSETNKIK